MKFYIQRTYKYGRNVLELYPQLKKYNKILEKYIDEWGDDEWRCINEINSLKKLLELKDAVKNPIIIHEYDTHSNIKYSLEIYDDYRE